MTEEKKRLIIIDSNSVIHRAYHALPPLTTKEGELVNAVYGYLLVFFRAIKDFQPDFIVAAFDFPAPTFRHKRYVEYKAKRPKTPPELYNQIPKIKEVLKAFDVSVFSKEGFEADDIIGTVAREASKKNVSSALETIILSGDLDSLQLVDSQTRVYALRKGVKDIVLYDEKLVKEKFQGLEPRQLLEYKALRGDPSDNIPGVTGVGEKTATNLILEFGSIERLYEEIGKKSEKSKKLKLHLEDLLIKYKDQAFLSRELAEINTHVPIDIDFKKCSFGGYDKEKAIKALEKLGFYSLIGKIPGVEKKEEKDRVGENLKLW
jgi:DNA polymerase-1